MRKVKSMGSWTGRWFEETFGGCNFEDTIYISGNPYVNSEGLNTSKRDYDASVSKNFGKVVDTWDSAWDEENGTVMPRDLGKIWRKQRARHPKKRLIVHFIQPHTPYISVDIDKHLVLHRAREKGTGGYEESSNKNISFKNIFGNIFKRIFGDYWYHRFLSLTGRTTGKLAGYDSKSIRKFYIENLSLVLREIRKSVDRLPEGEKIVVTSDHGEFLGENDIYGHSYEENLKILREVPWLEVEG